MIVLDTHVWVWWTLGIPRLRERQLQVLLEHESDQIGISTLSCWEIAKLVQAGKLRLPVDLATWFENSLKYPGVELLPITPEIAIESNRLPGSFHRDPADQTIVATARVYQCALVSSDSQIRRYPYVETVY